ncbi:hypothetical protein [Thermoflavimicrobium dichotomicum]|uniref:Phage major tail protein, phi13 family n=1 Tax=Thermoflavimicrobium dichotomicum TaxID=46223 RepID=A0A1I3UKM0_9BACL|nr:hypothetical protein [Thermoflavimicrobium dichotomicum]SFJ83259.1 hypothetical protein SAMN05421852_12545 [Thermoflavimicrobium dichotomicum]
MATTHQTHGITRQTIKNMLLDAGAVYVNYGETDERLIGATSGGNTFTVEREIKIIEIDGARGKVKGARRITEENAVLTINLLEMSAENFKLMLTAADVSDWLDTDGSTVIGKVIKPRGQILDSDYVKNIALVATVSGTDQPCVIILKNVLADDELEIELEDKEEGKPEVALSAHYDPEKVTEPPYEIRYPAVSTT